MSKVTMVSILDKVEMIEAIMAEKPQVDIPVRHYFANGVYAREITIPAGVLLTGRIHKYENLNILSEGEISVLTENGMERFKAPAVIVSPPGTKRIALAHTRCVWTTILGTRETDPEKIEQQFTVATSRHFDEFQRQLMGH